MRLRPIVAIVIVPLVLCEAGERGARAQGMVESGSLPHTIPLDYTPGSQSAHIGGYGPEVTTPESTDARATRRRSILSRLVNPFDGGSTRDRCGRRIAPAPGAMPDPLATVVRQRAGTATLQGPARDPFEPESGRHGWGLFQQASPQATPTGPAPATAGGMAGPPIEAGAPSAPAPGSTTATPTTPALATEREIPGIPPLPPASGPGTGTPAAGSETAPGTAAATTPGGAAATTPGESAGAGANAPISETLSAPGAFGEAGEETGAGFGGVLGAGSAPFAMIGDIAPLSTRALPRTPRIPSPVSPPGPPPPPGARGAAPIYPSVRNFNISENQSPRPQDRVFFDFNYYNNIGDSLNSVTLSPVTRMKAYIYNFGIEKTFNKGLGSIGIHIPLDNLTADSYGNVISTPTSTSPGNLSIFAKYILAQNVKTGSLVSACWEITPPTGPGRFAGAPYMLPLQATYFQPCIAYIYNYNRLYFQGFSGFGFSMNPNDVSWVYNDIGVGYYVLKREDPLAFVRAVAPVFEVHVNDPVNHRDWQNRFDLAGTADNVSLTYGLNIGFRNSAVLTAALVTPVTGPRPFDSEAVLMVNIYFGRTRRAIPFTPPPAVGG